MTYPPPRSRCDSPDGGSASAANDSRLPTLTEATRRNGLLARLSADRSATLLHAAEVVQLDLRQRIYESGSAIEHVYFPVTAVVSLVTVMSSGPAVEIATVGNEGLVGLPALLGEASSPARAFAQVPGAAVRVPTATLATAMCTDLELGQIVRRYALALLTQVAQTAACNRLHAVEQRCARWLLMTHDRVGGDRFDVTQDFLAQMLGVRRATVSAAAGALQQAGLIRYSRGRIRILDREGLERTSCECFATVRGHYERVLG